MKRLCYTVLFIYCLPIFRMTEYDRKYYICDPRVVNWNQYYIVYGIGACKYLLRDSFDNYKQTRKNMARFKYLHYTLKYTCIAIVLYIFYIFLIKFVLQLNCYNLFNNCYILLISVLVAYISSVFFLVEFLNEFVEHFKYNKLIILLTKSRRENSSKKEVFT